MKPLIGITTGTAASSGGSFHTANSTNTSYIDWVVRAGGVPVMLPNVPPELVERYLDTLDALLLSGGLDIQPLLFGEEPHKQMGSIDVPRDRFELPLIRAAVERKLPVMGICRGIQSLNVALGGTLRQDLVSDPEATVQHRMATVGGPSTHHTVALAEGSRLREILGVDELPVNSFHHQAVGTVGQGLEAVAHARDGTIEAIEGAGTVFLIGVQWHPEVMTPDEAATRALFAAFVAAAQDGQAG